MKTDESPVTHTGENLRDQTLAELLTLTRQVNDQGTTIYLNSSGQR